MPTFKANGDMQEKPRDSKDISDLVQLQVQREVGCVLDHMEKLGESLCKVLDNFVLKLQEERARLVVPPPEVQLKEKGSVFTTVSTCDIDDSIFSHGYVEDWDAIVPIESSSIPGFPSLHSSDPASKMALDIDLSLPPTLDGKDVSVTIQCKMRDLTVSFDGTSERLTGEIDYTASWFDPRVQVGAQLPEHLWTPFSGGEKKYIVFVLPWKTCTHGTLQSPFVVVDQTCITPKLSQRVKGLTVDAPITDLVRLRNYPHDFLKVDILLCCWEVLEATSRQVIKLEPDPDEEPLVFHGNPGGPEWTCESSKVSIATHTPQSGITYSDFVVSIGIRRSGKYYLWKVGLTLFVAVLMACLLLVISAESVDGISARLTGLAAVLFVIFGIQQSVSGKLPRFPVFNRIDNLSIGSIVAVVCAALHSAGAHFFWRVWQSDSSSAEVNRTIVSRADTIVGTGILLSFACFSCWLKRSTRACDDRVGNFPTICENPLTVLSTVDTGKVAPK